MNRAKVAAAVGGGMLVVGVGFGVGFAQTSGHTSKPQPVQMLAPAGVTGSTSTTAPPPSTTTTVAVTTTTVPAPSTTAVAPTTTATTAAPVQMVAPPSTSPTTALQTVMPTTTIESCSCSGQSG